MTSSLDSDSYSWLTLVAFGSESVQMCEDAVGGDVRQDSNNSHSQHPRVLFYVTKIITVPLF